MTKAAIGIRAHSGWAMLAAVAGSVRSPIVILRRRIELIERGVPKQPYHAAKDLPLPDAEILIHQCTDVATRLATAAIRKCIDDLRADGYSVDRGGVLLGSGRSVADLAKVLASHPMLHTAEGVLIRNTLREAGESCGLAVSGVKEKELYDVAASRYRLSVDELRRLVTQAGRGIGPPWGQDQKDASLVAWLSLD
ncbi:MAG: hypothetical protein M3O35_10010 [Acidobacteriota bacterium]|nr:hypothetical protein [Acidobacteriota bacterium]